MEHYHRLVDQKEWVLIHSIFLIEAPSKLQGIFDRIENNHPCEAFFIFFTKRKNSPQQRGYFVWYVTQACLVKLLHCFKNEQIKPNTG
ncbi:MAG: hypothetical protein EHM85_12075 [Desulfobacteraceae bacterium]|nr:MAG: hypothetical protein EHM85_12075 [Desulfobacteraceae bacterium]